MTKVRTLFFLLLAVLLCLSTIDQARADVYPSFVRITQEGSTDPFDGDFTDLTGAAIRFFLNDAADSVVIDIAPAGGGPAVKRLVGYNLPAGDNVIIWDGSQTDGSPAPADSYALDLTAYSAGYSVYTQYFLDTPAIFTRGVGSVNNPALRWFGFIYAASNGGYVTGVARHAPDGTQYGDVPGNALLTTTGVTVGPQNRRYATTIDDEGYVYLIGRDERRIFRYHLDTLDVQLFDSSAYGTIIQGLDVRGTGSGKYLYVAGDSAVFGIPIGTQDFNTVTPEVLVSLGPDTGKGLVFWDAEWGEDNSLYVVFRADSAIGPYSSRPRGVFKFDLSSGTTPKYVADTVWTATMADGDPVTLSLWDGGPGASDDILYMSHDVGSPNTERSGVYAWSNLDAASPTRTLAWDDTDNNTTSFRGAVVVDAVGNVVYFENSNEQVVLISPPTGPNSYTYSALDQVTVTTPGVAPPLISISAARIDLNGDRQPDRLGDTVKVLGVVNSTNVQTTNFGYFMQDDSAGIHLFQFGLVGAPALKPGDRVLVLGVIAYFRGTTEISPVDLATDIILVDTGNVVTPIPLTIDQYRANPEMYESRSIELAVANPASFSASNWPAAGSSANLNIWGGGRDSLTLRLDSDTPVPGSPYPTFPVKLKGIGTQFTSSSSVHDNGYQITPFFPTDFTPIDAPPARYFPLLSPANNATWSVASAGSYDFRWRKAAEFNGDNVIYQFQPVGFTGSGSNNSGADTVKTVTGTTLLGYLGSADSLNLHWTVLAKDPGNPPVANLDTFSVTLKRLVVVESLADHVTSRFRASVTNEGTIGSLNDFVGSGPGNGFQFPIGTQQLFGDGIMIGIDSTHVSDAIRRPSGTPSYDGDFRSLLNMDTTMSSGLVRIIKTAFDDSLAEAPIGVQVHQTTISIDTAGLDNILWYQLDLTNKSGAPLNGLTAGAFLDWDLVPGGGSDLGTVIVDSTNTIPGVNGGNPFPFDIVEMHNGNSPTVWTALVPMNTNRFYGRRIAINNGEVYAPHVTEGDKWRYMTTLRAGNPNAGAASPGDHSQVAGLGPYDLAANATQRVGFAMVAANSLQELVNSARIAQQVWVQVVGNDLAIFVVGVASGTNEIPETFDLAQNYPNPFNPSTTIRYSLPTQSAVSLSIYNVLGQKVATLVDEVKAAGVFEVLWNGRNEFGSQIASGVYFYRLEARPSQGGEPFTMFKKMMLLK